MAQITGTVNVVVGGGNIATVDLTNHTPAPPATLAEADAIIQAAVQAVANAALPANIQEALTAVGL